MNPQAAPNFDVKRIQGVFEKLEGIVTPSDQFGLHIREVK